MGKPWHGIDLDGTLAEYEDWQGPSFIGRPIPLMMERVEKWLAKGERVKILTARASHGERQIRLIKAWLKAVGLPELEVTDKKDSDMIDLWDDNVVTIQKNTGRILTQGI